MVAIKAGQRSQRIDIPLLIPPEATKAYPLFSGMGDCMPYLGITGHSHRLPQDFFSEDFAPQDFHAYLGVL